ncbi:RNA polymerase sigma-70 factor (ECF subfamily) [Streptomonospora nanhaiensis]|uniref:RNA polymerase sigma-70 factor (ECF subfamily) n=1 Tax=Streptomonospora nanhaiensis TaxID=1323731 RepID=A0A853BRC2_9ACTN|nr:RNA polymerase sigma factor SigJ [Streptomonospora nanhaiensis]NYI97107.1 RNA polymerase sigma-70 factor (ECF subfamily) [Streptomonospora nanhaiensis]
MQPPEEDERSAFHRHRGLVFTLAYDILGTVADAEDVVQETWLRWAGVDPAGVDNPRAYIARVATRLAVDRLRRLQRLLREDYVGPWLPEPLVEPADPADGIARAEAVTFGLLVVLRTLSPLERAAFVLREAFGFEHAEIARVLDRSPEAVRQLVHRARRHVQERRPRFEADRHAARAVAERFVAAAVGGDLAELLTALAPDVVLWNDGGGRAPAALRPVRGSDKVARLLAAVGPDFAGFTPVWIPSGGGPTVVLIAEDGPRAVVAVETDPSGRFVQAVHALANPDKLRHVNAAAGRP